MSNRYCSENLSDWQQSWFPLLSDGAAGMWFVDVDKIIGGELPVFYSDPEAVPKTGQIYDSIKAMFETFLECYEQKVYYTETSGSQLRTNFHREVEIAKKLNPKSDFWLRDDLF